MQALIVGAGRGSRLLPASRDPSKPLVPILVIAGSPLEALWAIAAHAAVTASVDSARTITLLRCHGHTAESPMRPSR
jgi:dTDP-glucose pyrophosphorylase